jgi:hypothetical protein
MPITFDSSDSEKPIATAELAPASEVLSPGI